jgi:hypothetical protein
VKHADAELLLTVLLDHVAMNHGDTRSQVSAVIDLYRVQASTGVRSWVRVPATDTEGRESFTTIRKGRPGTTARTSCADRRS